MAKKPCEFCNFEYESQYVDDRNGFCMWLEVYPSENLIVSMCQANDEDGNMIERSLELTMNYCPVCGRKLI